MSNTQDEVLYAVAEFGALTCEQVYTLIRLRGYNHPESAANCLIRHKSLYKNELGYLSISNTFSAEERTIEAFDVLLEFMSEIEPRNYFNAKLPAQIVFVKKGVVYEICVIHENDYALMSLFNRCNRGSDKNMVSIICVDSLKKAKEIKLSCQNKIYFAIKADGKINFYGG